MLYQTFKKIVESVIEWNIEIINAEELDRTSICDDNFIYGIDGNVKTILNCFNCEMFENENSIIIANGNNQINIFRTDRKDNKCIGYKYLESIDTTNKTQIQITAELATKLPMIINTIK